MRTRAKFTQEIAGFSLKFIKRIEVKFDPFHVNANSVREFYEGVNIKKVLRSNPECVTKAQIASDLSDPLVTVQYRDNHKLVINSKYLESSHISRIIRHFEPYHQDEP